MIRVAIVVIALLVGAAALPVIGAAREIADEPTCRELGEKTPKQPTGNRCFSGSTPRQVAVVAFLYGSGAMALLTMVIGAVAAARGSRGILFGLTVAGSALLFVGAYVAARI